MLIKFVKFLYWLGSLFRRGKKARPKDNEPIEVPNERYTLW